MSEDTPNPVGRPTLYDPEKTPELVRKLCLLGAIDTEIADILCVHVDTIYEWKNKHDEFSEAIQSGKEIANANVADALYNRAIGYSHADTHFSTAKDKDGNAVVIQTALTKHYAPDTAACFIWLKNRDPERWRDRKEITGPGGKAIDLAWSFEIVEPEHESKPESEASA